MYLDYYGLEKFPFSISPDPAFLWFGNRHQEAFAVLRYGILEERGFLCLTGEVGTGKTVLIRNLINTIEVPTIIISVPDPDMKPFEFFRYIASEIKLKGKFRSKADFLMAFQANVNQAFGTDTRVLMIIDEAQRLNYALLEQVRLLSNIVTTKDRQLNIFLVGQNELDDLLLDERAKATRQRIAVRHKLKPLREDEVAAYMYHRLQVAGADRVIFTPDAIDAIARQTNCIPRGINVIADQALLKGYEDSAALIDAEIVNSCPAAKPLPQAAAENRDSGSHPENTYKDEAPEKSVAPAGVSQARRPVRFRQAVVVFFTVLTLLAGFGMFYHFFLESAPSERQVMQTAAPELKLDKPDRPDQPASGSEIPIAPAAGDDKQGGGGQEKAPERHKGKRDDAAGTKVKSSDTGGAPVKDEQVTPQAARSPNKGTRLVLHFKFDSIELTDASADDLRRYLSGIDPGSENNFRVSGYTDASGDYWYNKKLSQRRANAVSDLLVQGGVNRANILAVGMGSDDPLVESGHAVNPRERRRVEVVVSASRQPSD